MPRIAIEFTDAEIEDFQHLLKENESVKEAIKRIVLNEIKARKMKREVYGLS